MIIVEGPDLVGKTTLCNALVTKLHAHRFHHVYQHFTKLSSAFPTAAGYIPFFNKNVVMDRFYMSRQAYGLTLGNQEILKPFQYKLLDAKARNFGAVQIVIVASDKLIKRRYENKDRDEMYGCESILAANREYLRLINDPSKAVDVDFVFHICDANEPLAVESIFGIARRAASKIEMLSELIQDRHVDDILTRYVQRQQAVQRFDAAVQQLD